MIMIIILINDAESFHYLFVFSFVFKATGLKLINNIFVLFDYAQVNFVIFTSFWLFLLFRNEKSSPWLFLCHQQKKLVFIAIDRNYVDQMIF